MAASAAVTWAGRGIIANRMNGAGANPLFMAWGTWGTTGVAAPANVNLGAPATEARATGVASWGTTSYLGDTLKFTGTLTCLVAGKTIGEVGLFDSATSSSSQTLSASLTAAGTSMTLGASLAVTSGNFYGQIENETVLITGAAAVSNTIARAKLGSTSAGHSSGIAVTIGGDGGCSGLSGTTTEQTATIGAAQGGNCFLRADHGGQALNVNDSISYTISDTFT